MSAAAVLANLDVMDDEELVERSAALGRQLDGILRKKAEGYGHDVGQLDGRGLFYSI